MYVKVHRPHTVFLTISAFAFGLFILINLMADQLTLVNSKSKFPAEEMEFISIGENEEQNFETDGFVAQGRRKPKATNMENNPQEIQDKISKERISSRLIHNGYKVVKQNMIKDDRLTDDHYDHTYYENDEDEEKYEDEENYSEDVDKLEIVADKDEEEEEDDEEEEYNENNEYEETQHGAFKQKDRIIPTNSPFKEGDFGDISGLAYFQKPLLKYEEVAVKPKLKPTFQFASTVNKSSSNSRLSSLTNGIYWSENVENLVPKGFNFKITSRLIQSIRRKKVQALRSPSWNFCGRPKNGLTILEDGSYLCARYRDPHNKLVLGEILSFYLSLLLGMDNVPPVVLSVVNSTSEQWRAVAVKSLGWEEGKVVALIQWISNLDTTSSREMIPPILLDAYVRQSPVTSARLGQVHPTGPVDIPDLVQWGTMIIFDYLTANYDRVASMQDAADTQNKPSILQESIRNLRKTSTNKKLWLMDNESGLLDAYELLYSDPSGRRFVKFHDQMLQTMCVFQKQLVKSVSKLYHSPNPYSVLEEFAQIHEPLIEKIPKDKTYKLFVNNFSKRLKDVYNWMKKCEDDLTAR